MRERVQNALVVLADIACPAFLRRRGGAAGAVVFVLAAAAGAAAAATPGVNLLGNVAMLQYDRNNNFGWRFTTMGDIDVSALGFFDVSSLPGGSGAGLAQPHDVGIFRVSDQALVTSVTVPQGTAAPLISNYRYSPLPSPVRLTGGTTYLMVAYVLSTSPDALPGVANWAMPQPIVYANMPTPTPANPLSGTGQYVTNAHGNPPDGLGWADVPLFGTLPAFAANFAFTSARRGDLNCDGVVNFADINPFVLALTGQAAYEAAFPNCRWLNGDVNADGQVNFADINPFVALLSGN